MSSPRKAKARSKSPVSPFSKGGGGVCFEHVVGAYFLSHLLVGTSPRGADDHEIDCVKWQRGEIDGIPLDDVVVTLNLPYASGDKALMSLQLKHDMAWGDSEKNTVFRAVMRACWDTFKSPQRGQFDRFGVVVGVDKADFKTYLDVIQTAENCHSGDEFDRVIQHGGAKQKNFATLIRHVINIFHQEDGATQPLSNDQLWGFLRRFCLLHFDLLETSSRDVVSCCNNLKLGIPSSNPSRARATWNELLRIVAESNRNAGSCDRPLLEEKLVGYLPPKSSAVANTPATPVTMEGIAALFDSHLGGKAGAVGSLIKMVDDSSPLDSRRIEEERIDAKVDSARTLLQKGHAKAARQLLEEIRVEESFSPRLRFRIQANLGACASMLGDNALAIQLCRAAYEEDKDNPNAMVIKAQAELLDDKPQAAIDLCVLALDKDPRNADAAVTHIEALLAASLDDKLTTWLKTETWILDEATCAPALARWDWRKGNLDAGIKRLERFQKEPKPKIEVAAYLAWLLMTRGYNQWKKTPVLSWKMPHKMRRDLTLSAELYEVVLKERKEFDDTRQSVLCLSNRAVALMLLSRDVEAKRDLEQAVQLDDVSPTLWINIGWLHLKNKEFEEAVKAHEKAHTLFENQGVVDDEELEEAGLRWENTRGLATALYETEQWEKLRSHLESVVRWDGQSLVDTSDFPLNQAVLTYDFCRLIGLWLQALDEAALQPSGRLGDVQLQLSPLQQDVVTWLEAQFPDHPEVVLLRGEFAWFKRQYRKAIKLMRRAASLFDEPQRDRATLVLAEALYHLGRYRASAPLFKATVREFAPNSHLKHYALALLRSGNPEEARRIAVHVRALGRKAGEKQGKAVPVFSEIEAECAEFTGDLEPALRLRRELMVVEPHRHDHVLAVALLEYKLGHLEKAQAILQTVQLDEPEKTPELTMGIAHAKAHLHLPGALELGYRIWRAYPNDSRWQVSYMMLFQNVTRENDLLLHPEIVGVDCAVTLKRIGSKQQPRTRVLVSIPPTSSLKDYEQGLTHPQSQALLGKRVGDVVTIKQEWEENVQLQITEIRHRFVYAFQETSNRLERGDIWHEGFKVSDIEAEGGMEEYLKKVAKMLIRNRQGWELLSQFYRRHPLPLSSVGLIRDRFCLELWNDLASVGGRFYSSDAVPEQLLQEGQALVPHRSLVLDATALGCIRLLDIQAQVKTRFARLLVPQAVKEELVSHLERESRSDGARGYLTHDGIRLRFIETNAEYHSNRLKAVEDILQFVDKHCEVVATPSLLQEQDWVRAIGKGAVAAVLLAKEQQIPLWSDDARLRQFARDKFGVESTYYFPVLWHLRQADLSVDALQSALCRLALHGYTYVWLPAPLLVWRLRQDSLVLTNETRNLLFCAFNGYDVNLEWVARELADFIETLWNQTPRLLESQFKAILHAALGGYLFKRSTVVALRALEKALESRFEFDPVSLHRLSNDIARWEKTRLRVIDKGSQFKVSHFQLASLDQTLLLGHPDQRY